MARTSALPFSDPSDLSETARPSRGATNVVRFTTQRMGEDPPDGPPREPRAPSERRLLANFRRLALGHRRTLFRLIRDMAEDLD